MNGFQRGGTCKGNQEDFQILGETAEFLAVNKPSGLLVHPTKPGGPRTLWDGLRDLLGFELANGGQISLVNRLDRETSGVVLVAKTAAAARHAGIAMTKGCIGKEYLALVFGWPEWEATVIDAPIVRRGEVMSSDVYLERAVHPAGVRAITRFEVLDRAEAPGHGRFAALRAIPFTGRTHQIRVHLAHAGHPVLGDKIYAAGSGHYLNFIGRGWTAEMSDALWLPRHALHCQSMKLGALNWVACIAADLVAWMRCSRRFRDSPSDFEPCANGSQTGDDRDVR